MNGLGREYKYRMSLKELLKMPMGMIYVRDGAREEVSAGSRYDDKKLR